MGGVDASKFVNPEDDDWYAIPPEDNPDDEWKFPINNCEDASDAWNLRGSGDISISQETLEGRIKRRASDLGCDLPETADQDIALDDYQVTGDSFYHELKNNTIDNMSQEGTEGCTDCGGDGGSAFDGIEISDMTVEFIADQHEGVQELREEVDELQKRSEAAEKVEETLELDEGQSIADAVELLVEQRDSLQSRVDEYEGDEKEKLIDEITERTDRWDEDDMEGMTLDQVEDRHELVMELTADERTANSGGDNGGEETETTTVNRQVPWE